MQFDLQRFDETANGPKWINTWDGMPPHYSPDVQYFIPSGKTYARITRTYNVYEPPLALTHNEPNGNDTIAVTCLTGVPSPDTSTTVTASLWSGYAVSDVVVTGSDRNLLRITIDGVEYMADDDGKLIAVPTASIIGAIKACNNGVAYDVASIYNTVQTEQNLTIRHNNADGYVPLTTTKPSAPCLAVRHTARITYAMK